MEAHEILTAISGSALLNENRKHRNQVAAEIQVQRNKFKEHGATFPAAQRNAFIRTAIKSPEKFNDSEALLQRGLDMLEASHQPCPPLPCGADDHWLEQAEYARYDAFAYIDAAAILETREAHRNRPNLHAFDEAYYGED